VLLQGTSFIRDIFNAPLHDGRTMIVDLFLLLFAFARHVTNEASRRGQLKNSSHFQINFPRFFACLPNRNGKQKKLRLLIEDAVNFLHTIINWIKVRIKLINLSRDALLWVIPGGGVFIASMLNGSTGYFYLKQYLIFLIMVQFIYWIIRRNRVFNLIRSIQAGSFIFFITLFVFYLLNFFTNDLFADLVRKNSFPVLMLIMFAICKKLNLHKMQRNFFILGLMSAVVASTKIFFILGLILIFMNISRVAATKGNSNPNPLFALVHYFIVFSPLYLPFLAFEYLDLDIEKLISMGENRYNINDDLASLVSRLFSVPFMMQDANFYSLFGNGEGAQALVLFWGYPVHNIYASLLYAHGIIVFIVLCFYNVAVFRWLALHADLGVIMGVCLIYFNDIYPLYSIFFLIHFISIHGGSKKL
jgi:hypothetical protein